MKTRGLGRGLSALLKETTTLITSENELVKNIDITQIEPGNYQPRKDFADEKIKELAESITHNGLLQPIIVSAKENDKYKIIAGERRWRACQIAGLTDIPVIIKQLNDKETLEVALVENIQRQELNAIEEAEGYERLIKEFNYTQEELAKIIGKSRSHIANMLRLNQLPKEIKEQITSGALTMGHARSLIGNPNALELANKIIAEGLNVRQIESLAKSFNSDKIEKNRNYNNRKKTNDTDEDLARLAQSLSEKLGMKISIENKDGSGKLTFYYNSLMQLDCILSKL